MSVATPGLPRTAASVVDLIGNTPLIRLSGFEAGLRNVELYAKAEWRNPGGSVKDRPAARMIADGERSRRADARQDPPRRHVRQHRHRLRDDRRRARLPRPAVRAGERDARAEADPAGVRRRDRVHRPDGRVRRRHHHARKAMYAENPDALLLSGPVQQPRQLARRTTTRRRRRSSSRPAAGSRTSSPASARAARSSAPAGGCASSTRRSG